MGLSPFQALSIVTMVYFIPAFAASVFAWHRRGLGRQLCWVYLFVLALARIVGASLQIASEITKDTGMAKAERFLAAMGIVPMLLVMLAIIEHVKSKTTKHDTTPRFVWTALYAIQWAAFIVSIIAAARSSNSLSKASIILFAAIFIIQATISLTLLGGMNDFDCDRLLVLSTPISIPFLAVRVLYGVLSTFQMNSDFDNLQPNIIILSFMQYLMEFIVITLFLTMGLSKRFSEPRKNAAKSSGTAASFALLDEI